MGTSAPTKPLPPTTPTVITPGTKDNTIIFIGPEGSGKSTIGRLLACIISIPLFSLDRHRDALYAPYNYSKAAADEIYDKEGLWAFYSHWSSFEYLAVQSVLKNEGGEYYGQILDFGAGHSVYEDEQELEVIRGLMEGFRHVFLFVPCKDVKEGLKIMEQRRGQRLELNELFLRHESNALLAKHTIFTKDKTPEECLEEVLGILRTNGWDFKDEVKIPG